jgi:membrane protease YdiL (CAAX protease family)
MPAPEVTEIEPAEVPVPSTARPRRRLAAAIEVVIASGFPTQLALGALLVLAGVSPWDGFQQLSLFYIVALLLLDTIVVVGLIVVMLRASGERPSDVFLGRRPLGGEARLGLGYIPVVYGATTLVLLALRWGVPWLHNVATNPFEGAIQSTADALVLGAAAVVGGGVKEELQRAFVLHRFDQHLGGARAGVLVYSAVFGAGHLMQGWDVALITMLLGLAWGIIYLRRRSAVAPMVSHCGFNAAQILQFLAFGT